MNRLGYALFPDRRRAEELRSALASESVLSEARVRILEERLDPELAVSLQRPHAPAVGSRRFAPTFGVCLALGLVAGLLIDVLIADVGAVVYGGLLGGALGTLIAGIALLLGSRRQRAAMALREAIQRGDVVLTVRTDDRNLERARDIASKHEARLHVVA